MKCYNCDQEGHRASDCPEEKRQKKGCFNCGGDHKKAECPNLNGGEEVKAEGTNNTSGAWGAPSNNAGWGNSGANASGFGGWGSDK